MIMSLMSDKFYTSQNIINLLRQSAQYGICAIGMTMLILLGGIDLSVGSVQALAGVGAVVVLNATGSIPAAVCTGVLIGALVGLMNSLIITKMKITPLICTLGTMSVISGVALVSTRATSIQVTVRDYMSIGMGRLAGIPVPVLILAVLIGVFYFILNHTTFGRYIYAIGGNKSSAELAGIPVDKIIIAAYIISGMLTGLSAVILSARLGSGQPSAGTGFEMTVIAAVIIGGVSLAGGKGSLIGALIGTLTLYVLNNGLVLLDVSSFWQDIMRGALIIVAVYVDQRRQSKASRELLRAKFAVSAPDRGVE
jgi:ribose transport system permease protein